MAEQRPTKESICNLDYPRLSQLVLQEQHSQGITSFKSQEICDDLIYTVLNHHWCSEIVAEAYSYPATVLRRSMVRQLRFGLQKEGKLVIDADASPAVYIEPAILEAARTVHALSQKPSGEPSGKTAKHSLIHVEPYQPDKRQKTQSTPAVLPNHRIDIAQRHKGLVVWKLGISQGSVMIWERKIHLQQFLNLNTQLTLTTRRDVVKAAKFFTGTKIISKKDWLVPPAFLSRYAGQASLHAEALGFINLASSSLAEPPQILRCSNCPITMNVGSHHIKHMYEHVSGCLDAYSPDSLYGFCACGRLFATKASHDDHSHGCEDMRDVMKAITG